MASLEDTEGAPKRERVERLLAALQAAGQTAATERKRAELLIASWEASAGGIALSQARAEEDAAHRALEERGAERRRAEALLGLWQDAEATAAAERARAEALLATLREADERAALKRAVAPRRKPEPEVQDQPQEAAAETEALTPAPLEPEDAAGAPAAPDQLAALPGQPEATDAALSQEGGKAVAPEQDEPSLEAVERLLRARREDFEASLDSYLWENWADRSGYISSVRFRLLRSKILGREAEDYFVEVMFERYPRSVADQSSVDQLIVSLRIVSGEFQIVGHREVSADERPEQAARAPATPEQRAAMEAVERLLREREEAFRTVLQTYLVRNWIEYFGGRDDGTISFSHLRQTEVLGAEDDTYRIRTQFYFQGGVNQDFGDIVVFLKIDGEDFEIVGHEIPSYERPEQAAAPDQLAALPSQTEATDAALSQAGKKGMASESEDPSLEAVERLLKEQEAEFLAKFRAYAANNFGESNPQLRIGRISLLDVLGADSGRYKVRVIYDPRYPVFWQLSISERIVFIEIDGDDFEIVGHAFPSGEGREQAAAQATDPAEASGEFSGN